MTPDPADPAAAETGRLAGYEVIVGLTGGIAAYKTCSVISKLAQAGCGVTAVVTRAAGKFIGLATLQALTGRRVYMSLWDVQDHYDPQHIGLTEAADLMLVAPATANILGKVANGLADDLLSTMIVAADCPVIFAPAMNSRMWANPIVQDNVARLRRFGYPLIDPTEGWLACRTKGPGRMAEPEQILAVVEESLTKAPPKAAHNR